MTMTVRKTITAVALALLWAPVSQSFGVQNSASNSNAIRSMEVSTTLFAAVGANDGFDQEAFDRKNVSRKKFGLKPMTPEEFMELEAQVQVMAAEQEQKAATLAKETDIRRQTTQSQRQQAKGPGFFDNLFSEVLRTDTCESNFDCEAPKVCCDFGVSKVCCAGGSKQRSLEGELALVPVPVDVNIPQNKF